MLHVYYLLNKQTNKQKKSEIPTKAICKDGVEQSVRGRGASPSPAKLPLFGVITGVKFGPSLNPLHVVSSAFISWVISLHGLPRQITDPSVPDPGACLAMFGYSARNTN